MVSEKSEFMDGRTDAGTRALAEAELKIFFFLKKFKNHPTVSPRGSNNQNLKEIAALGTDIIATRSADSQADCCHSQAGS